MTLAVHNMLVEWDDAVKVYEREKRKGVTKGRGLIGADNHVEVAHVLALSSKHSLIEYPCAFHLDVSGLHGGDDIENKVTMICLSKSQLGDGLVGRGGCGTSVYVYAVMDWRSGSRKSEEITERDPNLSSVAASTRAVEEFKASES